MYESFFGLERAPFSLSPDPHFLYSMPGTREAFAGLLHGVLNRRGFVVMTGESGTGKSTLLRAVLGEIPKERLVSSLVFNPMVSADEFLELAMLDFGLTHIPSSKAQRLMMLNEFLLENHVAGQISVLLIDEAHMLTPELLEQVRMLTNFEKADTKLLQIVLSGHSELDEILERRDLRQLKQRIAVRVELKPLDSPECVAGYMVHRWRRAGGGERFGFEPAAVTAVAQYSQGIPRTINAICDSALLMAYGQQAKRVTREMIADVASTMRLSPVSEEELSARWFSAGRQLGAVEEPEEQRTLGVELFENDPAFQELPPLEIEFPALPAAPSTQVATADEPVVARTRSKRAIGVEEQAGPAAAQRPVRWTDRFRKASSKA